jgi:tight adherence protein B
VTGWLAAALACAAVLVLVRPRPPGLHRLGGGPGSRPRGVPVERLLGRARGLLGRRVEADRERARAVEACAVLAAELRAGRPPAVALGAVREVAVGRTREVLSSAAAAAELGGDVPEVLARGAPASAAPALLRGLAACWALCASTGAGLAAAVERLRRPSGTPWTGGARSAPSWPARGPRRGCSRRCRCWGSCSPAASGPRPRGWSATRSG